ncbi:MAG: hypothetical protein D6722_26965 [Bacteroidetes bacterium]|nr:MAG: hypothetical protein D6722_26965 [Bacteroidota bacterium]
MKRVWMLLMAGALVLVALNVAWAGSAGKMELKVGDEVYVCNCGEACPCQMMAHKAGQCVCGTDLAKAKVVKVEGTMATVKIGDREQVFNMVGKYACACGPQCKCGSISQKPGKCVCGTEMKPVEG